MHICPVLGFIHRSDWLNVWNVKGQWNVLYYSLSLWKAMCVECFLVWVGVDCLCFVSRVKDLKQWASVFSATCGFRNHCIKIGYEKSRVTSTRHDASCVWRMLTFRAWESQRSQVTWKEKNIKHWHPRKGHQQAFQIFLAFLLNDQRLKVMMSK